MSGNIVPGGLIDLREHQVVVERRLHDRGVSGGKVQEGSDDLSQRPCAALEPDVGVRKRLSLRRVWPRRREPLTGLVEIQARRAHGPP